MLYPAVPCLALLDWELSLPTERMGRMRFTVLMSETASHQGAVLIALAASHVGFGSHRYDGFAWPPRFSSLWRLRMQDSVLVSIKASHLVSGSHIGDGIASAGRFSFFFRLRITATILIILTASHCLRGSHALSGFAYVQRFSLVMRLRIAATVLIRGPASCSASMR